MCSLVAAFVSICYGFYEMDKGLDALRADLLFMGLHPEPELDPQ